MQVVLHSQYISCAVELQWGEYRVYTSGYTYTRNSLCDPMSQQQEVNTTSGTPAACIKREYHESVYRFGKAPFRQPLNYVWR